MKAKQELNSHTDTEKHTHTHTHTHTQREITDVKTKTKGTHSVGMQCGEGSQSIETEKFSGNTLT